MPPTQVTRIIDAIDGGDPTAAEALLPLVYDELRKLAVSRLARESPGQTLQATALVHEAYLRLIGGAGGEDVSWNGRSHFFAAAAEAMRRILIDRARAKGALKRSGNWDALRLDRAPLANDDELTAELIDLDDALAKLAAEDPAKAKLVELRFFAGLSLEDAARIVGISPATADRHWAYARAWLYRAMSRE